MNQLLIEANNSLISQSKQALKAKKPVNGDGFGIGWYPTHNDPEPGTFTSVEPAWNNKNLRQIAYKIKTSTFFAHVRDATPGLPVIQTNCHPFAFGRYLWMHNGEIGNYTQIKRPLQNSLTDHAYHVIQGSTDSELAYAIFLDKIKFASNISTESLKQAMIQTIKVIVGIKCQIRDQSPCILNFAVTNGETVIACRYTCSPTSHQPSSLFYSYGQFKLDSKDDITLEEGDDINRDNCGTIISSEPLSHSKSHWHKIDRNHLIIAQLNQAPIVEPIVL